MILRLLASALMLTQATLPSPEVRTLVPGGTLTDSLSGGDRRVFAVDVPAGSSARVVIRQDGIDIGFTLRREGSNLPDRGLDLVAGFEGEELVVVPIFDAAVSWRVFVHTALPRSGRGNIVVSLELAPADDQARRVAVLRARHQAASDLNWVGDGPAFQQSQAEYAAVAAAALETGDVSLAAEATFQSARSLDNLGDTPGAFAEQHRALALFRELNRRDREARVLNRLGDLSRKMGEVAEAERFFELALPLARAARDQVSIADILNNSGLLLSSLGRYEEAITRLKVAIPLAQEVNSANVETALLNNLADAYSALGEYDQSIEFSSRALIVVARLKLPRRTARTHLILASAQFENGNLAAARESLSQALVLFDQAADRTGMAQAIAFDGLMRFASGETDQALELFARAQPLLRAVRSPLAEARVLTAWAGVEVDRGQVDQALLKADQALDLARSIASPASEHRALYVRARALHHSGRLAEAVGSMMTVIEGVETARALIQRSEWRSSYLATVRRYYDLAIELLIQQGDVKAAFEMSERARARSLLEGLAASAAKIEKGVDPALTRELRAVQAALNAKENYRAQMILADGKTSRRALAAAREIARLIDQWNGLRAQIRAVSPAYSALHLPEPSTLAIVQRALDAGTALIEYHLGATRSYVWVVDRDAITVAELPSTTRIESVGRPYHELLSREIESLPAAERDVLAHRTAALGRRLAGMVWTPIESRVRGKRLVIAADGVLQYLPFAALPSSAGAPLITRHEIVYTPSASVLERIRRDSRPLPRRAPAAVFADPVFSNDDARLAVLRSTGTPHQASPGGQPRYPRLRFSRLEAEAIGAASHGTFQALDFMAAKRTLTASDLRKYRILHFATHGSLDTERPELSGLILSLVDARGAAVDGHLRLHEIYNLDLNADLIVLSACRTALGQEVYGEGLMSLTRGFMYAGASRVVSSVWNVDDRASARLMAAFYTAMLSDQRSPATALREAQLTLLRDPRWSSPHYWAAFGLHGEWQ